MKNSIVWTYLTRYWSSSLNMMFIQLAKYKSIHAIFYHILSFYGFLIFAPSWLKSARVSPWQLWAILKTANLLTLNSSKTEFLLIGLPQQLAKINTCSLVTTHSAHNLGFITALHAMQTQSSDENSVRLSVHLSVCLSNACIVTKRKKDLPKFLYQTKEHLA